jgi:hypothetical protein
LMELRPETPERLATVVEKMLAKNPWLRPQTPQAVVKAVSPWTDGPIPLPPAAEMPRLSPAATLARTRPVNMGVTPSQIPTRRSWVIPGVQAVGTTVPSANPPITESQTPTDASQMDRPTHPGEANDYQ